MSAIVSHAQSRARKGFARILVNLRDFHLCHLLIGKRDHDGLCVCDFNILMVIFVQNIAFRRHFLRHGNRTGYIFNRDLPAAVGNVMPDGRRVHLDLEHCPGKPFLRAFIHLEDLQAGAGLRRIRCAWRIRCIRQVGYRPIRTIRQFSPRIPVVRGQGRDIVVLLACAVGNAKHDRLILQSAFYQYAEFAAFLYGILWDQHLETRFRPFEAVLRIIFHVSDHGAGRDVAIDHHTVALDPHVGSQRVFLREIFIIFVVRLSRRCFRRRREP